MVIRQESQVAVEIEGGRRIGKSDVLEVGPGVCGGQVNRFSGTIRKVAGIASANSQRPGGLATRGLGGEILAGNGNSKSKCDHEKQGEPPPRASWRPVPMSHAIPPFSQISTPRRGQFGILVVNH